MSLGGFLTFIYIIIEKISTREEGRCTFDLAASSVQQKVFLLVLLVLSLSSPYARSPLFLSPILLPSCCLSLSSALCTDHDLCRAKGVFIIGQPDCVLNREPCDPNTQLLLDKLEEEINDYHGINFPLNLPSVPSHSLTLY